MILMKRSNSKPKHASLLHSQWLSHIKNCTQGKLIAKEYCAEHGLSLKRFKHHDWLERRKQKQTLGHFALVKVVSEPVTEVWHYEIIFPRGVILRVPTLNSLPAILKSLECYL